MKLAVFEWYWLGQDLLPAMAVSVVAYDMLSSLNPQHMHTHARAHKHITADINRKLAISTATFKINVLLW